MPTLIVTKGLPASGKTTWAREQVKKSDGKIKRVNKDDLRAMVDPDWNRSKEKAIILLERNMVYKLLSEGFDVIVDNTHIEGDHIDNYETIAKKMGAEFVVQDFTDVPLSTCLKRDAERANAVGEATIRRMYKTLQKQKPNVAQYKEPEYNPDLPNCIIVDIDGTLAHMNGRSPYDYSKVHTDLVDKEIREIVNANFWDGRDVEPRIPKTYVVIVSGREDGCKEETLEWLKENQVWYDEIYMRKNGDHRDDKIVKKEIYEEFIKPRYNIRFVLDDRDRVVKMWREEGLKVLQVAEGDF